MKRQQIQTADGGLGANRADKSPKVMKTTNPTDTPLRAARLAAVLSAIRLASMAETTETRIFMLERKRFRPRLDEARRLSEVLGLPLNQLFPEGTQPEVLT